MKILFFASLRERLGLDALQLDDASLLSTQDVLEALQQRGEQWQTTLQRERVLVAVNQSVATWDTPVGAHDEVAFFPPVTGG